MNHDEHVPVMPDEVIDALAIEPEGMYVDCTFGRGGHSRLILNSLGDSGRLMAFDRDRDSQNSKVAKMLARDHRFGFESSAFSSLEEKVVAQGWRGSVAGILMDIGLCSSQIDNPRRGFSIKHNGELDMRMDTTTGISASEWIAGASESEIVGVLRRNGEERFARRIARAIIAARSSGAVESTHQLARVIEQAVPVRERNKHPATRSFQAIRIHVNDELGELQAGLFQAVNVLKPGGRLVVISFHSLEDRIVKRFIRKESHGGEFPKGLPVPASEFQPRLRSIGKAIHPGEQEVSRNIRARSAVLRVAQRVS